MANVVIYTSTFCGFCYRAKSLLKDKKVNFEEVNIMYHPKRRPEMIERANGGYTVPQIFINDHHIGGYDELYDLDLQGKLDLLLKSELTL